jgi:hypothetical protein
VSNEIALDALRKELQVLSGHQVALTVVVAAMLTESAPPDVERFFEGAEAYLSSAGLPREVLAGAREEIRALRSTYRTS